MTVEQMGFVAGTSAVYGLLGYYGASSSAVLLNVGTFFGGLTGLIHSVALLALKDRVSSEANAVKAILGTFVLSTIVSAAITNLVGGSISAISASTLLLAGVFNILTSAAIIVAIVACVTIFCCLTNVRLV